MTVISVFASIPPLNPMSGVVICNGPSSESMPRGGRALTMPNMIPFACNSATAERTRPVRILSSVTSVPSTSEITADILGEGVLLSVKGPTPSVIAHTI
jgi:hypothetical protein